MNRRHFLMAGSALVGLAVSGLWQSAAFANEPAMAEAAAPNVADIIIGNPDAKVTMIEYGSYSCPACANFHKTVFKDLKKDYIDTGKIRFIYREMYLNRPALWAAMVVRCGGEMRYFGLQDMIYTQQDQWYTPNDPGNMVAELSRIGKLAGIEPATLEACLQDGAMAKAMVEKSEAEATADDVTATPTLFINGKKYSGMSYADLKDIIDPLLAE